MNRPISILLSLVFLVTLPSCQHRVMIAGRVEGFDQGGKVLILAPSRDVPAIDNVSDWWTVRSLAEEITPDSSGRFSARIRVPYRIASVSLLCGDQQHKVEVLGGDSLYYHCRLTDSVKRRQASTVLAYSTVDRFDSVYPDWWYEYQGKMEQWLSESAIREHGMRQALDSLDRCWDTIFTKYLSGLSVAGMDGSHLAVEKRLQLRHRAGRHYFADLKVEDLAAKRIYNHWRLSSLFRKSVAPRQDRFVEGYTEFYHYRGRLLDSSTPDSMEVIKLRYITGSPALPQRWARANAALNIAGRVAFHATGNTPEQDTVVLARVLVECAKRGYHTRADSVARAAFELYRAGLRRGHAERSFNNQAWSLGAQSAVTPAGERTKAILVWCWLANSQEAMREVGPLAEIEHRLRALDVRSVHVCFDNGDRAMREELYQLGQQGEYWYSDRQVRGQLLEMLGFKRLEAPRLLLLSPDGQVLDAALPDATDVEGVVKRVGERL